MATDKDIESLRALFPVTREWTYLYNGSIHPCPSPVGEAMRGFLSDWERGGEASFFPAFEAFEKLRERFAALIHAEGRNIVVTESTTSGLNLAAQILRPRPEQNVVVTDLAFMSDTYLWLAGSSGVGDVRFVESRGGKVAAGDLAARMDSNTAVVHICAVTVGGGYRYDLQEVRALTAAEGVPLMVDGAQAIGLLDVDVSQSEPDFLATTASKWLMGPTGIGFLYVADRYLQAEPPWPGWLSASNVGEWDVRHCELYNDARRFQGGIPNLPGVVGALAGLELLEEIGRETVERRVRELTTYLMEQLATLESGGVRIWTPSPWNQRAGIVFFRVPGHEELHARLREARIYCGTFQGGIRLDPGVYNTMEEIDAFLDVVREHCRAGRS